MTTSEAPAEVVHAVTERGITTITLDSPANRNALSTQLTSELGAHLTTAGNDAAVRAVVVTHTGTTFCAGADMTESAHEGGPGPATARLVAMLRQIVELPKPVMARIDGKVRGGGNGLVAACDIAIAATDSTFAFTEARLGVAPAIISLTVLPRLNDRSAARYFLTGDLFDATEAARVGLLTEATDDLDAALAALIDGIRACSPQGLAESKALTTRSLLDTFDDRAEHLAALSARLFSSDEAREGITAFLERRPPEWAEP
jgi:enoyl-CoA hydratase